MHNHHASNVNRDRLLLIWIATIAIIVLGILPMFIGSLAAIRNLDLSEQGWIISAESYGMLLGTVVCASLAKRIKPAILFICAGLIALIFNTVSAQLANFQVVLASRFMAGCGAGLAFSLAIYYLGLIKGQERSYGITLALQTLVFCGYAILYPVIVEYYSAKTAIYSIGIWFVMITVAGAFLSQYLFRLQQSVSSSTLSGQGTQFDGGVAMLGMFLLEVAIFSLWGYVGNIGMAQGISEVDIGWAFGIGLLGGLPGAGFAALAGNTWGRKPFILIGCILIAVPTVILATSSFTTNGLMASLFVMNVGWMLALSYYMAHIAANDPNYIYVRYMGVTQCLAVALAPTLIASVIVGDSLAPVFVISATCSAVAGIIVYLIKAHPPRISTELTSKV
ncbi:Predicted arabinose efflux permease, MFS family [Pseudomonas sp. NFACC15-1]|uniref:MFS transporter n=1 Tax=unclassified Pseudomonas TaxID=196821 RepID=UPI00088DB888|nr:MULTISPECIES: MFS transporter [unclassified Pseudomonas]SDA51208.1 Predicted arabinose efflux permease, MFS family [Pseudomonas sp. NFACC15-1]SDW81708.1 Predicted arabinose efflux permease, MFS family [Pseudomonas sp. NFACC14]